MPSPGRCLVFTAALGVVCLPAAIAHKRPVFPSTNERARAIQALNRLTFGPRPGDVDRVRTIGVDKWIDKQLHPDSIDDQVLDSRLAQFRTLRMSPQELAKNFPPPAVIKQIANGKEGIPRGEDRRAIYESQLVKYREKKEEKTGSSDQPAMASSDVEDKVPELLNKQPDARMQALLSMPAQDRSDLLALIKGNRREELVAGMSP